MSIVTLDDEDGRHIYYHREIGIIPGVSEVLTRTGIAQYPDTRALRQARHRGSCVHKAVELHCKGTLDEESLNETPFAEMQIKGYLDGAKRFIDERVAKILRYELIVWHNVFFFAGKLDILVVLLDGRLVILDWKSGEIPWWIKLQTGTYLEAIKSMPEYELESGDLWHGAVQLCPDGTYKEPRLSQDRSQFARFRQALDLVNYTNRRGR